MPVEEMLREGVQLRIARLLDESAGHFLGRRFAEALECLAEAQDAAGQAGTEKSAIGLTWDEMRALITRDWDEAGYLLL